MYGSTELPERLCLVLERERALRNYSQVKMAKALGMSISSYKRMLNGEKIKFEILTIYRIQLMTGMYIEELCDISSPIVECLPLLRQLSESQLSFIKNFMRFEINLAAPLKKDDQSKDLVTLLVPTGDMHDGMIYNSCNLKKVDVSAYRPRFGQTIDCALLITGCYMQPAYQQNDILLISSGPIRDGDTGVFIDNKTGRIFLRKYFQTEPIRMEPVVNYGHTYLIDNSSSEDIKRWTKLGYVITKMR